MKLTINEDACIGCGCCIALDPDHFDFTDDGLASVINNKDLETSSLESAVSSCPTSAILLDDGTTTCGSGCGCCDGCACHK